MQSSSDRGLDLTDSVLTELYRAQIPPENFAAVLSAFGRLTEEAQYDLAIRLLNSVATYRLRKAVEKQKIPQPHQRRKQLEDISTSGRRILKLLGVDKAETIASGVRIGSNLHPTTTTVVLIGLYKVGAQRYGRALQEAKRALQEAKRALQEAKRDYDKISKPSEAVRSDYITRLVRIREKAARLKTDDWQAIVAEIKRHLAPSDSDSPLSDEQTRTRPEKSAIGADERLATLLTLLSDLVEATEQSAREISTRPGRGGDRRSGELTAEGGLIQAIIKLYIDFRERFPSSGAEPAFDEPLRKFVRSGLELAVSCSHSIDQDGKKIEPWDMAAVDRDLPKSTQTTDAAIRGAFQRVHKPNENRN